MFSKMVNTDILRCFTMIEALKFPRKLALSLLCSLIVSKF